MKTIGEKSSRCTALTEETLSVDEVFSSFLSFLPFYTTSKKVDFFFAFLCFDFLVDSCPIKAEIPIFGPLD